MFLFDPPCGGTGEGAEDGASEGDERVATASEEAGSGTGGGTGEGAEDGVADVESASAGWGDRRGRFGRALVDQMVVPRGRAE